MYNGGYEKQLLFMVVVLLHLLLLATVQCRYDSQLLAAKLNASGSTTNNQLKRRIVH
jgi:hypothetical protein